MELEHNQINDPCFAITGLYQTESEFLTSGKTDNIKILIVEYPAIHEDILNEIENVFKNSGAQKMILVYGFTNSAAKKILNNSHYILVQAPITIEHLHAEIKHLIESSEMNTKTFDGISLKKPAPARSYSNNELIKLSSASTTIKCECPQHLSSMILKLIQFEVYSTQCENRNSKDADLHALLGKMTGHARAIMEKALTEVIKAEG